MEVGSCGKRVISRPKPGRNPPVVEGTDPPAVDRMQAGNQAAIWRSFSLRNAYSTTTGILPILACHSRGPVLWTDSPVESTATVTGMSSTVNS